MPTIWTIGYERLLPAELVAELQAAGVERLIDVRFRPQSRRPGMSKTRLGELLSDHGIAYEHRKALGTPPDIRWLYKHNRVPQGAAQFREHVESTAAHELDELARGFRPPGEHPQGNLAPWASVPRTALMCLEADPAVCHRRTLTEALRARVPKLTVIDL
ncbi:MAG TPA: DUF488 domain-containing protein [Solirubrobacteraceae bacterium]|nr:DUF488 domain-containing protein [Solirubrobacteraceae bacterium]